MYEKSLIILEKYMIEETLLNILYNIIKKKLISEELEIHDY